MYGLRHTGATWMLANGTTLERIQDLLGHSSIVPTRRYAHVVDAGQRQAVASWDTAPEGIRLDRD